MHDAGKTYGLRLLALCTLAMLLVGCQASAPRAARSNEDWGRGVSVGASVLNAPVGLDVSPVSGSAYLTWVSRRGEEQGQALSLAEIDSTGRHRWSRELALEVTRPSGVNLAIDASGQVHLCWLDEQSDRNILYHSIVGNDGAVVDGPRTVSSEGLSVSTYALGLDSNDLLHIVWAAVETDGGEIYRVVLDASGEMQSSPLGLHGTAPAFRFDDQDRMHLVWQKPGFGMCKVRYTTLSSPDARPRDIVTLASEPTPTGLLLRGPSVGLDAERVYVFWALERRGGGATLPKADSYYSTLPPGKPDEATEPRQVVIPPSNHPAYEEIANAFGVRQLASASSTEGSAEFVYFAAPNGGQREELAVAFSVEIEGRTKALNQTVLTIWSQGSMRGYQIVGETSAISLRPSLVADDQGALHAAWIDTAGFGTFDVYYATTSPSAIAYLNRTTTNDVVAIVLNVLWGTAQAFGFLPMVMFWLLPALALLGIYALWRAEDGLDFRGPRIVLVLACAAYLVFKYSFRSSWLTSLRLPTQLLSPPIGEILMLLTPLLVILLAIGITYAYARWRDGASMFVAFFIFAGTDALLTLLIYVPSVLAE